MSVERASSAKPLVLPDTYDGSKSWDDWISHFENVADVNEWNDGMKLKWIKVRLIGRAQKPFQHLGDEARESYAGAKAALRSRFEPESKQSCYQAELETRRKKDGLISQRIYVCYPKRRTRKSNLKLVSCWP